MTQKLKYSIIANPKSGGLSMDEKHRNLQKAAGYFGKSCDIFGLDTGSKAEFMECAKEVSQKTDVLIIAGGDGTVSDVYNSVDSSVVLGYIPMGSGNMLKTLFRYPKSLEKTVEQIKNASPRTLDLILCNGKKKALMTSFGFDGEVLLAREELSRQGIVGKKAYEKALLSTLGDYERRGVELSIDGEQKRRDSVLTCIVTKVPFYGYGIKMVPKASIDDGMLHSLVLNPGRAGTLVGLISMAMKRNIIGEYAKGQKIEASLDAPTHLQIDGNVDQKSDRFTFEVLPKALKIKY